MATVESELALATRYHALVLNHYDRRPALARRNILPTLIRFLRSTDRELRRITLDCIALLGKHPQNHALLSANDTLEEYVRGIQQDTELDDPEIHNVACGIMKHIFAPLAGNIYRRSRYESEEEDYQPNSISSSMRRKVSHSEWREQESEPAAVKPVEGAPSLSRAVSPTATLSPATRDVSGAGLDSAHMVTFDVPHLYPRTSTETLEHVLQTTKGVISYHLHPTQHQMRVYMICKPPVLQQALEQQANLTTSVIQDEIILMGANVRAHSSPPPITYTEGGCVAHPLNEDPTATRRATYWSLTRLFAVQLCQTVWVYCSPSKSTIEARVAWQRETLSQDLAIDTSGGASGRLAERLGKMLSRLW